MSLIIRNLTVDHGAIRAINNLSFIVEKRRLTAVIGANGAGKSTLLRTLSGLNPATSGKASWGDHNLLKGKAEKHVRNGVSHVSEGKSVIPELTVEENLDLGALWRGSRKESEATKKYVLELFPRLGERLKQRADTLSGGERQSFLLGLNLFFKRDLLLLDEHTSALDPKTAHEVMRVTAEKLKENDITCIMTTHSLDDALKYGNRLIAMQNGQIIKTFDEQEKYVLSKSDLLDYCY